MHKVQDCSQEKLSHLGNSFNGVIASAASCFPVNTPQQKALEWGEL